jgi:hypothetical protein
MLKKTLITLVSIVVGATIGGLCGYQINAHNWGAIKDPENVWAWATIIGAVAGAIVATAVFAIGGSRGTS